MCTKGRVIENVVELLKMVLYVAANCRRHLDMTACIFKFHQRHPPSTFEEKPRRLQTLAWLNAAIVLINFCKARCFEGITLPHGARAIRGSASGRDILR